MAESVDALVSNTSRFTPVPVRPRLRVLKERSKASLFLSLFSTNGYIQLDSFNVKHSHNSYKCNVDVRYSNQ